MAGHATPLPTADVTPTGTRLLRGVEYATPDGFRPLLLDLHLPAAHPSGGPVPVIVFPVSYTHLTLPTNREV